MLDSVIRQSPVSGTSQGFSQPPLSYSGITPSVIVADIYGGLREDSVKRINFANFFFNIGILSLHLCAIFFTWNNDHISEKKLLVVCFVRHCPVCSNSW